MWMKDPKPAKRPPRPPKVELAHVFAGLSTQERTGPLPPDMAYLKGQLPEMMFDRWGKLLPLSIQKQERLDRLVAIMAQPFERGRELLLAGYLDTIEANAIRDGHPDVYAAMSAQLQTEMAIAGPPLPAWSESVLGVFFGRDAALIYNEGHEALKPTGGKEFPGKAPLPTPADLTSEKELRS
jgi:hypothetical protein